MTDYSTTYLNNAADALETTVGTAPNIYLYSSAKPANCAAADGGGTLMTQALPSDWLTAATGGVKSKNGAWAGTGSANGLARHYRIKDTAGTTCHMQGLVSMPWAASTAVALNTQMHLGGNVYIVATAGTTASSGGPTGTGSGITDGTVTWNYVGKQEMAVDNVSIAVSQPITISTFTHTVA